MRFWSIVNNHGTHLAQSFLMHKCVCKILTNSSVEMVTILTHFHFQIIQNNIMDFIDNFWCSDLIWTTWTWYGFCARSTTTKFGGWLLSDTVTCESHNHPEIVL